MEHRYRLVDVFASEPLAGNPLAVFPEGARVPDALMQRVANELRLSETTFVLERGGERRASMRIFTPEVELPFAGHPTLGTAHVLALEESRLAPGEEVEWTLLQGAGPVRVGVRALGPGRTRASLLLEREPRLGPRPPARAALAAVLGLAPEELGGRSAYASHGTPFLLVELASVESLARAALDPAACREHLAGAGEWARKVYPFVETAPGAFRARLFAPSLGVPEDPATGSAAATLAAWLAHLAGEGTVSATIRQGIEMGRPSELEIEATAEAGRVRATRVAGQVVTLGEGLLRLP